MIHDYDRIKSILNESKKEDIFILKPVASGIIMIKA
jgi:hypothetical protein